MEILAAIGLESYLESFKGQCVIYPMGSGKSQNLIQKVSKCSYCEAFCCSSFCQNLIQKVSKIVIDMLLTYKTVVRILFRKFQSPLSLMPSNHKPNVRILFRKFQSNFSHIPKRWIVKLESYLESFKVQWLIITQMQRQSQNLIQKVSKHL